MTAFYNCGYFGGAIPAAGITLGTQFINSNWQWRLPLIFQAVPSLIVMVCVFLIPESPRWQLANSRDEEALAFLAKYHGNGDPKNPVVCSNGASSKKALLSMEQTNDGGITPNSSRLHLEDGGPSWSC